MVVARKIPKSRSIAVTKPASSSPQADAEYVVRADGILNDPNLVCLLTLTAFAILGALYVGRELLVPLVFAIILKLLLQPVVDALCNHFRVPQAVSAMILILGLFCTIAATGFAISGPASGWVQKTPEVLPSLKQKLTVLRQPIDYLQKAFKEVENVAAPADQEVNAPAINVQEQSTVAAGLARGSLTNPGGR